MAPNILHTETDPSPEDHNRVSTRDAIAKLTAERLTPARVAMVEAALKAFDIDSYSVLTEM